MTAKRVVIIGGGISGLSAAYELTKQGHEVTLLEREETLGGLARSVRVGERHIERYYHFVCGGDEQLISLIEELDLDHRLHWRGGRTSYYVRGRLYPFATPWDLLGFSPLSLRSRLRFGLHAARCRRMTSWRHLEHLTAKQWLMDTVGAEVYEIIWHPLLQVKFGQYHDQISASWLWHRIHRLSKSRSSLWRPEKLGYLVGGSKTLLDALAERIVAGGGTIRHNTAATGIVEEQGKVVAVSAGEEQWETDAVVSAVALPELVPLLPPGAGEYREQLAAVDFVGVRCVMLQLNQNLTDSFWINVNDERIFFNGFIEYSNLNPWREYGGAEILYMPMYLPTHEALFTMPPDELVENSLRCFAMICPEFDRAWLQDAVVTQDLYAQAVCPPHFNQRKPALAAPLTGLYVLDSTQLYPSDRCLSGMIGLSRTAVEMIDSQ